MKNSFLPINRIKHFLLLSLFLLLACKKEPAVHYVTEAIKVPPQITNIWISKDTLKQSNILDEYFFYNFTYLNQYGEPRFDTESDSIRISFQDLRIPGFGVLFYDISISNDTNYIKIEDGQISVKVFSTCCIGEDNSICLPAPDVFETIYYGVRFQNNLGVDFQMDTLQFVVDCSF